MNSVSYSYLCFAKNKIKWTGSLENLKAFVLAEVDDETAEKTSWRSPSRGTWVFDSELLSVTWHSKSKNINFDGEKGKALTERIHSYLLTEHDTILQATNSYSKSNNKYCDVATKISKDLSKVKGASTTNKFSVLDSEEIHDDKDYIVISTSSDEDCSVYESKRTERKKAETCTPISSNVISKPT